MAQHRLCSYFGGNLIENEMDVNDEKSENTPLEYQENSIQIYVRTSEFWSTQVVRRWSIYFAPDKSKVQSIKRISPETDRKSMDQEALGTAFNQ